MKTMEKTLLDGLLELDSDTGGSLIIDMIASYRLEMPKRLSRLEAQLAGRDATALAFEAHAIKSSFANFGSVEVASIFQRIETLAKVPDWSGIDTAAKEIPAGVALFDEDILELEKVVKDPNRMKAS